MNLLVVLADTTFWVAGPMPSSLKRLAIFNLGCTTIDDQIFVFKGL